MIHPPVDTAFFTLPPRAPRAAATTSPHRIGLPYKRLEVIVEAFALLADRRLVVAGGGPQADVARDGSAVQRALRRRGDARAHARPHARRRRVRLRCRGGLRDRSRRGAGLRDAGDRLRTRRRARDGASRRRTAAHRRVLRRADACIARRRGTRGSKPHGSTRQIAARRPSDSTRRRSTRPSPRSWRAWSAFRRTSL